MSCHVLQLGCWSLDETYMLGTSFPPRAGSNPAEDANYVVANEDGET